MKILYTVILPVDLEYFLIIASRAGDMGLVTVLPFLLGVLEAESNLLSFFLLSVTFSSFTILGDSSFVVSPSHVSIKNCDIHLLVYPYYLNCHLSLASM